MAKRSAIEKNKRRARMAEKYKAKRLQLKAMVTKAMVTKQDKFSPEEQFEIRLRLAKLPRNANPTRIRNRCALTGRPRGFYRKFGLSRIALRELGSAGQIPGLLKASW